MPPAYYFLKVIKLSPIYYFLKETILLNFYLFEFYHMMNLFVIMMNYLFVEVMTQFDLKELEYLLMCLMNDVAGILVIYAGVSLLMKLIISFMCLWLAIYTLLIALGSGYVVYYIFFDSSINSFLFHTVDMLNFHFFWFWFEHYFSNYSNYC